MGCRKPQQTTSVRFSIKAVETVKRDFYMDDILKSVETIEAKNLVNELKTLCNEGGFNLTKWTSNRREVLVNIPVEERAKELRDLDSDASPLPMERTLGILWSPEVDEFQFRSLLTETEATRRAMLSVISSVYDPLGFISPLIIPAKMLLQEMCKQKAGWDDKPDNTTLDKWKQWTQNIKDIQEVKIDRCYVPRGHGKVASRELHAFSDANEVGYGVVIYLRSTNERGEVHVSLVSSKTRVVPLKKVTIPRLELTAATLAVKMVHVVTRELDFDIARTMYWTDSTAVLRYIANVQAMYLTFVANRVQLIREATSLSQWHHVSTRENPADMTSRGVKRTQDLITGIWFKDQISCGNQNQSGREMC
ncbi:uncharacterized protein LOC117100921 [Anneissia japonica]|uniref:uncharacterized protein LOC117100921 n=1 Tax=Anneissia japonica TaxID=1529436 RepID=UPI001425AF56|nr:uncharacterized protein LOC117100921 [Anneissia japonica]